MTVNSTLVAEYDPNVPYPVANIIISSYAHPIIFALSLGSIFWGGICALIVSHLTFLNRPAPAVARDRQRVVRKWSV